MVSDQWLETFDEMDWIWSHWLRSIHYLSQVLVFLHTCLFMSFRTMFLIIVTTRIILTISAFIMLTLFHRTNVLWHF